MLSSRQCGPEDMGISWQLHQNLCTNWWATYSGTRISTFLQAALIKQVLAEDGINLTRDYSYYASNLWSNQYTCKSDPILERQLNQICEAILRVDDWIKLWTIYCTNQQDHTLKQILLKFNMPTDLPFFFLATLAHVGRSRLSIPTVSQTTTR